MPCNRTTPDWNSEFYITGFGEGEYLIYQLLDQYGTPLYIGQTNDLSRRLTQHSKDKEWFSEIRSVWFERTKHRQDRFRDTYMGTGSVPGAYTLEKQRIAQFSPRYNQKTGRVKKFEIPTTPISALIPSSQHSQILTLAASLGIGPADKVRDALTEWLHQHKDDLDDLLIAS